MSGSSLQRPVSESLRSVLEGSASEPRRTLRQRARVWRRNLAQSIDRFLEKLVFAFDGA